MQNISQGETMRPLYRIDEIEKIRSLLSSLNKKIEKHKFFTEGRFTAIERRFFAEVQELITKRKIQMENCSRLKYRINKERNALLQLRVIAPKTYPLSRMQKENLIKALNFLDKELSEHKDFLFTLDRKLSTCIIEKQEIVVEDGMQVGWNTKTYEK